MIGEYAPVWFDCFRLSIVPFGLLASLIYVLRYYFVGKKVNHFCLDIQPALQTIILMRRYRKQ